MLASEVSELLPGAMVISGPELKLTAMPPWKAMMMSEVWAATWGHVSV